MPIAQPTFPTAAEVHALSLVTVTHTDRFRPAVTAAAWATLKNARGQTVDLDRLATPAHLILSTPAPAAPCPVADIATIRKRAMDRARCHAAIMGYTCTPTHGGDAA